ncbi:MAG: hypothetical protein ABTQ30_09670 [Rhizobiaceae bacterium]
MVALPAVRFLPSYPQIVRSVSTSRDGARAMAFVEWADPYWTVQMQTKPLSASERLLVEAFADAARDGLVTVAYTPKHMCVPRAYWGDAGNAALANTGAISAITNARSVTVNSIDNGLTLGPGDLVGFEKDGSRALARIQTGGVAAGNALGITFEPPLASYITTGAVVTFKNLVLNTRLLPGSFNMSDGNRPSASFTLVEVPK